jgi:integrase
MLHYNLEKRKKQSFHEKAALSEMRYHDLRHSIATNLLSMAMHPKVVQELLGHNRIQETVDAYRRVFPTIHFPDYF